VIGRGARRARRGEAAVCLLSCRMILRRAFICKTVTWRLSSSRAAPIIASSSATLARSTIARFHCPRRAECSRLRRVRSSATTVKRARATIS